MGRKAKPITHEQLDLIGNDLYSIKELNLMTGISPTRLRVIRANQFSQVEFQSHYKVGRSYNNIVCCICGNTFETYKSDNGNRTCSVKCKNLNRDTINSKISKSNKVAWSNPSESRIEGCIKRRRGDLREYRNYANKVHRLSEKVYQANIDILNPKRYTRGRAGVDGAYQLDHILTIKDGFRLNKSPEFMSRLENLRLLTWRQNLARNNTEGN